MIVSHCGRRWAVLVLFTLWLCGCGSLAGSNEQTSRPPIAAQSTATARPASAATRTARPTRARATAHPTKARATPRPTRAPATARPTLAASSTSAAPAQQAIPGFTVVSPEDLPPEAQRTIQLIADGGPFPYRQDGVEFQNRERLLPRQPRGYYHEYTVKTPGSPDRGARRIITGAEGEMFYTDDHYDSFVQVIP